MYRTPAGGDGVGEKGLQIDHTSSLNQRPRLAARRSRGAVKVPSWSALADVIRHAVTDGSSRRWSPGNRYVGAPELSPMFSSPSSYESPGRAGHFARHESIQSLGESSREALISQVDRASQKVAMGSKCGALLPCIFDLTVERRQYAPGSAQIAGLQGNAYSSR